MLKRKPDGVTVGMAATDEAGVEVVADAATDSGEG
jgi:hypothetical protein